MQSMINEWKGKAYSFRAIDPKGPIRTFSSRRPCHFIFEIQNYDILIGSMNWTNTKYFETPEFSVGNNKWTMCIYPRGKGFEGAKHISLYLRRQENGVRFKVVNVAIKFFILDQTTSEYLVIQDLGEKNFDVREKEWGIARALEVNHFENVENGFLIDRTCTFGAEVFVTSSEPAYTQFAAVKFISKRLFEIDIKLDTQEDYSESASFTTILDGESYTWKLRLYLNGNAEGSNSHVSVYLILIDVSKLTDGRKLLANFQFSIRSKTYGCYSHTMSAALEWFHHEKDSSGFPLFIETKAFSDPSTGYVLDQRLDMKVEFSTLFTVNDIDD